MGAERSARTEGASGGLGIARLCTARGRRRSRSRSRWVLICMRTRARARDRVVVYLCVYSPAGWEPIIGGSEEWIWGRRGAGQGLAWVLFFFEKRGGPFFLDWTWSPLFRREGRPWQSSGGSPGLQAFGGTGSEAGTRCARRTALGGCRALHLMRSGCLSQPARRQPLSQLLEHSRRRSKCARSRWPADPQERTDALCSDSLARCPGRAHGAWAGTLAAAAPALGRGSCSALPGVMALGQRGRAGRSLLAFPPTTRGGAFVFSLRGGAGPPPRRSRPGAQPALDSSFSSWSLSLFLFLRSAAFLSSSGSPGKVASPSLPKSSPSLLGGGWELGECESAIDPWSSLGLRAAGLGAAASAGIAGAEPRVGAQPTEGTLISRRTQGACSGEGIQLARRPFTLLPPSSRKSRSLQKRA